MNVQMTYGLTLRKNFYLNLKWQLEEIKKVNMKQKKKDVEKNYFVFIFESEEEF